LNINLLFISGAVSLAILFPSISLAENSFSVYSMNELAYEDNLPVSTLATIEDVYWHKVISPQGTIDIYAISFTITNDGVSTSSYEICVVVEGPVGTYTPSINNEPACVLTEPILPTNVLSNQYIEFPKGIAVSDITDITFSVQTI